MLGHRRRIGQGATLLLAIVLMADIPMGPPPAAAQGFGWGYYRAPTARRRVAPRRPASRRQKPRPPAPAEPDQAPSQDVLLPVPRPRFPSDPPAPPGATLPEPPAASAPANGAASPGANSEKAKPETAKPETAKPETAKPNQNKSPDVGRPNAKPPAGGPARPVEPPNKSPGAKPTEPKPTEPKPTEPKPIEPKPSQPKPTEIKPPESKPAEANPPVPAEPQPAPSGAPPPPVTGAPVPPPKPPELAQPPGAPGIAPSGARLGEAPGQPLDAPGCPIRLKARNVAAEPIEIGPQPDPRCTVVHAVRLTGLTLPGGGKVDFPERPTIACTTADAFSLFVRDLLSPLAKGTFSSPVASVWTGPGLECRSRDHILGAKLSAHGQGLAIDIGQMKLVDGRIIEIGKPKSEAEQGFETAARAGGCGYFHTALGPGTDAYHATHWHFDLEVRGAKGDSKYCK